MDNKPLNDELLRALAYYGAAGGSGGGGGTGTNVYGDLLGLPALKSLKYPAGVIIKDSKDLTDYGIAEELQHFFDSKWQQKAESDNGPLEIYLKDNFNGSQVIFNSTNGISLADNDADGLVIKNNAQLVFASDNSVANFVRSIENAISSSVTVDVANWSASTTTINGVAYYTNELSFTKVYYLHPEITIDVMANTDILPSKAQRDAYSLVTTSGYFNATLNNNKITCYSQVKPTSSFKIRVKGAK